MADWKDILFNKEEEMNDEELLKYLEGNLSEEEKHKVEKKLASSSFANDAAEGLNEFDNKKDINEYVQQLNNNLHKHLAEKKKRKEKRKLKDYPWIVIAVIIILALCIIAYAVISMHNKNTSPSSPANKEMTAPGT
jgi:CHASE3 domain sensor protein